MKTLSAVNGVKYEASRAYPDGLFWFTREIVGVQIIHGWLIWRYQ